MQSNFFKYITIISFFIIIIASTSLGFFFRAFASNKTLRDTISKLNTGISDKYIELIWSKTEYQPIINNIAKGFNLEELLKDRNFIDFAKDTISFSKGLPIVKFSLYDNKGKKYLSNTKFEVIPGKITFFNYLVGAYYRSSWSSNMVSSTSTTTIVPDSIFYINDNNPKTGTLVRTQIPILLQNAISDNNDKQIGSYVEIYYDISPEWQALSYFQIIGTIGSSLIFFVLYFILFLSSKRATQIIEKQHEANIELTEAKKRAEMENQDKSKFLANISHELRTPLNAIIGFSEIIKNESMGPINNEQYKEYINDINASGTHLLSLINDILDYSKAEAEKLQVESVELDVTKVIKVSMRLVEPRAQEAKISLIEESPKEHIIMFADPKRLKQVLLNLLSNAVKFTPEGGSVTIKSFIEEGNVYIHVQDTGIGIGAKDISKAMATFGQVDSKLSRKYEGTGLGLPLTKKLVELMKGSFEIESELGFGTTVKLVFPHNQQNNNDIK